MKKKCICCSSLLGIVILTNFVDTSLCAVVAEDGLQCSEIAPWLADDLPESAHGSTWQLAAGVTTVVSTLGVTSTFLIS